MWPPTFAVMSPTTRILRSEAGTGMAALRPPDIWRQNGGVRLQIAFLTALVLAACAGGEVSTIAASASGSEAAGCADVVDVVVRAQQTGLFTFDVTVSSTENGWDKYADAWEVRGDDGVVLGVRELLHPHEFEQPFTRSLSGVDIPEAVGRVTITARDSMLGFCGDTMTVAIPGRG